MKIVPVIFEDHGVARMRPLSWSTPVFELRCGMFNTRERVGMCTGDQGGILLGRSFLAGLNRAEGWTWGIEGISDLAGDDHRFLFLNGMLAPDCSLVRDLLDLSSRESEFVWRDSHGLVAALVDPAQARALAADWSAWENAAAGRNAWHEPHKDPGEWSGAILEGEPLDGSRLGDPVARKNGRPSWVWDIVSSTAAALAGDLDFVLANGPFSREPFGIFPLQVEPSPVWTRKTHLRNADKALAGDNRGQVYVGDDVSLAQGTALDTDAGPIILDNGVTVMPQCYLEGPLYLGPGSLVKPGSRIHGESSFGIVNRVAGEIGESTFGDFANKQHEGFIGHAVLGSWINLGAMTTCSDLKNNYGEIRVDLGGGEIPTGLRFVGLMMGDHAKTAIGTLFNTGTSVGFASNIFGVGMPPKWVGNFRWGGGKGCPRYAVDRARATAEVVMSRRGCDFTEAHGELFRILGK